jgi:ABC-type transport system involved in multi-copper enzyme maturation permease subunit
MITYALLVTALLFGGMTLYSFAFAAFLFTALPADTASALLHKAFPHFYAFMLVTAAIAAFTSFLSDTMSVALMIFISLTTVFARQILMPMINTATDAKQKQRFNFLHSALVLLTLIHIGVAGYVVVRLANV